VEENLFIKNFLMGIRVKMELQFKDNQVKIELRRLQERRRKKR